MIHNTELYLHMWICNMYISTVVSHPDTNCPLVVKVDDILSAPRKLIRLKPGDVANAGTGDVQETTTAQPNLMKVSADEWIVGCTWAVRKVSRKWS